MILFFIFNLLQVFTVIPRNIKFVMLHLNNYRIYVDDHHHESNSHVKKSGKSSKHDRESSSKGQSGAVIHKLQGGESAGKKSQSHENSGHSSQDVSVGGEHHSAAHRDGSKHKKSQASKVSVVNWLLSPRTWTKTVLSETVSRTKHC